MILSVKTFIKTIKRMFFCEKQDFHVLFALLPSYFLWPKLGFLLALISYLNQVIYPFLLVIGFSLFHTSLLSAMECESFSVPRYHRLKSGAVAN